MKNCFPNPVWSLWVPDDAFWASQRIVIVPKFINHILYGMLEKFCIAYIDDILIYRNSKKEYQTHVQNVRG